MLPDPVLRRIKARRLRDLALQKYSRYLKRTLTVDDYHALSQALRIMRGHDTSYSHLYIGPNTKNIEELIREFEKLSGPYSHTFFKLLFLKAEERLAKGKI